VKHTPEKSMRLIVEDIKMTLFLPHLSEAGAKNKLLSAYPRKNRDPMSPTLYLSEQYFQILCSLYNELSILHPVRVQ